MLAPATNKRAILMTVAFRVIVASLLTVAGIIGVAYLAKMLSFSQGLIITSSVIAGICGFIIGVYWTMTYLTNSGLTKSGFSTKK